MAIKTYKYTDKIKLSEHFNSSEFKCKCGKSHDYKIDTDLVDLLEKLMTKIEAESGHIYSAYRCTTHDKKVGGSGKSTASHVLGQAVDIYFKDKNGKIIPGKTVCLALEDMGHKYGIGYRCGGATNASGKVHIDVKPRKWYGDEKISGSKSVCTSYYTYFGTKKEITLPKLGTYTLTDIRNVYTSYSNKSPRKLVKDLTKDGRKHATSKKLTNKATLKKGTKVTVLKVVNNDAGNVWGCIPSGWICLISNNGIKHYK